MSPTTAERKTVGVIDDPTDKQAALHNEIGGETVESVIDETSLKGVTEKAAQQNRATHRDFRLYQKKVIEAAEVPNTHQTRQMTSHVCGAVARLPFVPDDVEKIRDTFGQETTEFEQQIEKIATFAEAQIGSEMVWTVSARKLARAALDLRKKDPDGKKGIAWVNDTRAEEAGVLDD